MKKWTDEKIKAMRLPAGRQEQRVIVAPGLYLRVRALDNGTLTKSWEFRAQVHGSRRRLTLGTYPAVSIAEAQQKRLDHLKVQDAASRGEADHPVIAARTARKARIAQPTMQQVFDEWVADKRLGSARKRGEPVRESTIKVLTENFDADIRERIGEAKVAQLTRSLLQQCIDAPRKRNAPGAAAHVYRTLRGLVNYAIRQDYITGADPMRGIENPRPYKPQPPNAASDKEIAALLAALDASRLWPATKLAIEFQLLTGARPGEVRLAAWPEFRLDHATWTIPAERFKSDRPFKLHLSDAALAVLKNAEALKHPGGIYVFPGANGQAEKAKKPQGAPMEKMAVARALSRLAEHNEETKKLRPHDLRRTFRTLCSRIGIAPHIAELCLGHVEKETMRRVYDGHDYFAECADAWDRAGAHIQALRRGGAHVVELSQKRA